MKEMNFETIGQIMIIRGNVRKRELKKFLQGNLKKYSHIKTVARQTSKIEGKKRIRKLKFIYGVKTFQTIHTEFGLKYYVDLQKAFFSPRLSYERQRIAQQVDKKEKILNFFSGVGPFSILIASQKQGSIIHSIEINKDAHKYLRKNIEINNCSNQVFPYLGDAFKIVPKKFINSVNRVLLPLPLEAKRSLPLAIKALKNQKGIIHWQITEHINTKGEIVEKVQQELKNTLTHYSPNFQENVSIKLVRVIRWIAPRIAHIAVDLACNRN